MAEIQELEDVSGELETVEAQIEQQPVVEAPKVEDDIPPQFRGKSVKEIAEYALATERSLSRQGNELGEVRRLADELLKSTLVKKPEPEPPKEVDFFENPQEAVRQAVANDPRVLAAEQYVAQAQKEQTKQAFYQKHPDAPSIVQDPEFAAWVQASKVRTRLFQAADNFDFDAGDELLSTYKELRQVKQQRATEQSIKVDTQARDAALRSASVETSGSGESSKKVYRRTDLIRLKMNNPAKYEEMADEIMAAYAEKRVR